MPAVGGIITLNTSGQGWDSFNTVTLSFGSNGSSPIHNYIVGNCGTGPGACNTGEFPDFFVFSIPALAGTVVSASLILDTATTSLLQSPSVTYQVTSLSSSFTFADLGTGTVYGSRTYTVADNGLTESIALDAAALSAIQAGGTFDIGGRVISPTTFGPSELNQSVFGFSGGFVGEVQLQITTAPTVPEPATLALFGIGRAGLGLALTRRKRY